MACTSGRECVMAAQPEPVHLVVMGHRSPGSEAAGEVRRATEGLPGLELRSMVWNAVGCVYAIGCA